MGGWLLGKYARFAIRRPWVPLAVAGALTIAAAILVPRLTVVTARSRMVDPRHPFQARIDRFVANFGGSNSLIAIARGDDGKRLRAFVDELAPALARERDVVRSVFHRLDLSKLQHKLLLYAPLESLRGLSTALQSKSLGVDKLLAERGLTEVLAALDRQLKEALDGGMPLRSMESGASAKEMLGGLASLFDELRDWLIQPLRKRLERLEKLFVRRSARRRAGFDEEGYLAGKDGRTFVLFIHPRHEVDSAENQIPFTQRVRKVIAKLKAEPRFREIEAGVTGIPASNADEMSTIARDAWWISVAAFAGIAVLFLFAFGLSFRILLAMLPIAIGTLWTFGLASAAVGHLTLMSSVFSAVLFGLGDDFGIHILSRFEEEWAHRGDPEEALRIALVETGPSVVTGAAATSIAFFCTMTVEVDAFGELGLIAGCGLLLVMLAAFLLQPPLLLAWARWRERQQRKRGGTVKIKEPGRVFANVVGRRVLRAPRVLLIGAAVVTAIVMIRIPGVPFDYDFLKMLPQDSEAMRYHRRLIQTTSFSSEFNAIVAKSLAEVRVKTRQLERLTTVGRVESVAELLPPGLDTETLRRVPRSRNEALRAFLPRRQSEKLGLLGGLAPTVEALRTPTPATGGPDPARLRAVVQSLATRFDSLFEVASLSLAKPLSKVVAAVQKLSRVLAKAKPDTRARAAAFEGELFRRLGRGIDLLKRSVKLKSPMTVTDLKRTSGVFLDRLVGKDGKYAIYAFPAGPIWERKFLTSFVVQTSAIDAEVTGFPFNYFFFTHSIREGFRWSAVYAGILIFLFLLIELRSIGYSLLAAIPLFVGATWMLGLMGWFGLTYNLANIVALPLILGMGVEYGIEMVHRFKESGGTSTAGLFRTTARAIAIAGLTTLMGLGSMAVASHRGLASLGVILVMGIGGCLLTAVVILPAAMTLIARRRGGS